eukprot:gene15119-21176_t
MEARNVPNVRATITTFWEGDIIDNAEHTFFSQKFGASRETDLSHWRKFPGFCHLAVQRDGRSDGLDTCGSIYMRWKEAFFVDPSESCTLTIQGFYYIMMDRQTGSISGFYYDPHSTPFQRLSLKPSSKRLSLKPSSKGKSQQPPPTANPTAKIANFPLLSRTDPRCHFSFMNSQSQARSRNFVLAFFALLLLLSLLPAWSPDTQSGNPILLRDHLPTDVRDKIVYELSKSNEQLEKENHLLRQNVMHLKRIMKKQQETAAGNSTGVKSAEVQGNKTSSTNGAGTGPI